MRERRGETELMRDSGKEDVSAHSWAKAGQLVTEAGEAEAWGRRERASEGFLQQPVCCRAQESGRTRPEMPSLAKRDRSHGAQLGQGKQRAGKHRRGFARSPTPGTCPKITGWRKAKQNCKEPPWQQRGTRFPQRWGRGWALEGDSPAG